MPDVRISELPAATTPLAGTELVPIVQSGVTRRVAASELSGGGASAWNDLTGTADKVPFDTAAGLTAAVGEITWNATAGTLDIGMPNNVFLQVGQEELIQVRNGTGSTITNGTAVMYTGTIGASTRIVCAPMVADGSVPPYNYLGIVTQDIASGADGYCTTFGKVRNINTLAYGEGDVLWLNPSVAGGLTPTEPAAPNVRIPAAIAINSASNGTIFVRSNTGMRLRDLSDVEANGGTTNRQVLGYVAANGRWEALTLTSADTGSLALTGGTLTGALSVPAGATGTQVPQAQEVVSKTSATGSAAMPAGTTAQRDGSPAVGYTRWNSTLGCNETYNGSSWVQEGWQTATATASGSSVDFTGIPSWANEVIASFDGVSFSANGDHLIQIGPTGGVETSGYQSVTQQGASASSRTTSFGITNGTIVAAAITNGIVFFKRITGNLWIQSGVVSTEAGAVYVSAGDKSLAGTLSVLRFTNAGAGTYDAGNFSVFWRA